MNDSTISLSLTYFFLWTKEDIIVSRDPVWVSSSKVYILHAVIGASIVQQFIQCIYLSVVLTPQPRPWTVGFVSPP